MKIFLHSKVLELLAPDMQDFNKMVDISFCDVQINFLRSIWRKDGAETADLN